MSTIAILETTPDTMTVAWDGNPTREVEIEFNGEKKLVSVTGGMIKKKNLEKGNQIKFRLRDENGSWGVWQEFEHPGGENHSLPPPRQTFEFSGEDMVIAQVEFPPVPKCNRYEVAMLPLDGFSKEWVKLSDTLSHPILRKKNLNPTIKYSFRYRGWNIDTGKWSEWSAASIPSTAPSPSVILNRTLTTKLQRTDGSLVDTSSILSGKLVALYFSASWCPPCRATTPKLVEFYNQMKAIGKPFEIIFVSADNDEASFNSYFKGHMNWLAIPYNDPRREGLQMEHQIRGIPSLKIISSVSGKLIEGDALKYPLVPATFDSWIARM